MPRFHHGRLRLQLHIEVADGTQHARQPAELTAEVAAPDGQDLGEEIQCGAQAPCRHAHVVEFLGILAQARARLLRPEHGQLASQDGIGQLAQVHFGTDLGRPEIGRTRDVHALGQQAGLELGERRRLQSAGGPQLEHQRSEGIHPLAKDPDFDPAQLHGALAVPDDDHGVVQRDLGRITAIDAQCEGTTAGSHLEDRPERLRPAMAWARRPTGPSGPRPRSPDAGNSSLASSGCRSPSSSAHWRRLERDFVAAALATGAHHEAGIRHPPVVRVEVRVDQPLRRLGQRGDRRLLVRLDGEGGKRGQPALDGAKIERVELPFDLVGLPFAQHCGKGTAAAREFRGMKRAIHGE